MAGVRNSKVGDFAFHPAVGIFALDVGADGGDEGADGPDAALWRAKLKAEWSGVAMDGSSHANFVCYFNGNDPRHACHNFLVLL